MVIPYDSSILYVEPIYLQATQSKLPELKRVIVAMGDQLTMASSIDDGIQWLTKDTPYQERPPSPESTDDHANDLTKKIIQIYSKAKRALTDADWVTFGQQFDQLDQLIKRLRKEP